MTIFRVQKKENYVVLDKTFLNDSNLSWQAKGLLAYMLSLPNDWRFSITDLTNRSKNGRDATANIVKELMRSGYIHKEQKRSKGKFGAAELLVFEAPKSPFTENPSTDNPVTESSSTENPSLLSNKLLNNKKNNNIVEKLDDVSAIIDYLNTRTGKKFRATTAATKRHVQARLNEGFVVEDFKRVIDVKCKEWLNSDMDKYLRPETLFGTKFEAYLNEAPAAPKKLHTPSAVTPPNFDFNAGEDVG